MQTALCSLTETLFAALLDVTLAHVLQADVPAAAAAKAAGGGAAELRPGESGGQGDASGGGSGNEGSFAAFGARMEVELEEMDADVEDMDADAADAAGAAAGVPAPASATAPGAGVRTRGVAAAEAREAELHQRIEALEHIKSQLEADLTELKESARAQLGVLDPEVLHRAALALEREVDREVDAVGPAALFAGGELEGMTAEQVAVARRANRLQQISADVIDRAIEAEPDIAEHLEQSMQRADASKSRDLLPTKKRRAFVLLALLARLRRSKEVAEVLLPWGLTIYLISLHSSPALVEGLRESLQARRAVGLCVSVWWLGGGGGVAPGVQSAHYQPLALRSHSARKLMRVFSCRPRRPTRPHA